MVREETLSRINLDGTTCQDFYNILDIDSSASPAEIKKAYKRAALKWHPDRNRSSDANDKFLLVSDAYEVLSNSTARRKCDDYLARGVVRRQARARTQASRNRQARRSATPDNMPEEGPNSAEGLAWEKAMFEKWNSEAKTAVNRFGPDEAMMHMFRHKDVVFSGFRQPRWEAIVETAGGYIVKTVKRDTDLFIYAARPMATKSLKTAYQLQIDTFNEMYFRQLLKTMEAI